MPEDGIHADGDIKEFTVDETSVICLIGTEIVDEYGQGFRAIYNVEDESIIVSIVNTINPDLVRFPDNDGFLLGCVDRDWPLGSP